MAAGRTHRQGSASPKQKSPSSGGSASDHRGHVLALQRSAGNGAVSALLAQRAPALQRDLWEPLNGGAAAEGAGPGGDGHDLTSDRFKHIARLQKVYDDKDRVGEGSSGESVVAIQQALTDLGYDLGGVDGIYGKRTAAAVRQFKTDQNLGFTQYGDVGPGTMGRLDQLFPGGGPPIPPDQEGPQVVTDPPGHNAGEAPDTTTGSSVPPPGIGRLRGFMPVVSRAIVDGASEVRHHAGGLAAEAMSSGPVEVQRDDLSLGDFTPAKLDAMAREKRRKALEGLLKPVTSLFDRLLAAINSVAEKAAELVMLAIGTVATAVLGPIGTFLSAVGRWFFGGSIKSWIGKQIRRLIRPILDPLAVMIAKIRTALVTNVEDLTNKPLAFALARYNAWWDALMKFFKPGIDFYINAVEWVRVTLAHIGVDVRKVPILKDLDKVKTDLQEYGKPTTPA